MLTGTPKAAHGSIDEPPHTSCHVRDRHGQWGDVVFEDFTVDIPPSAHGETHGRHVWDAQPEVHQFASSRLSRDAGAHRIGDDWTLVAQELMARLELSRRMDGLERQIKQINGDLNGLREHCEKMSRGSLVVPVATFAPGPFEVIKELNFVVQPDEECFVATLFDANLSSSGDTQEEAVANLKDLIVLVFGDFEGDCDENLGPMMRRQKHALFSLIRRQ
jgi:predicted RNase H-like HicB family nuclease